LVISIVGVLQRKGEVGRKRKGGKKGRGLARYPCLVIPFLYPLGKKIPLKGKKKSRRGRKKKGEKTEICRWLLAQESLHFLVSLGVWSWLKKGGERGGKKKKKK